MAENIKFPIFVNYASASELVQLKGLKFIKNRADCGNAVLCRKFDFGNGQTATQQG